MNKAADRGTVQVEIFGSSYAVRGEQDGDHLQQIASLVDRSMREIAAHLPGGDTARIAILAALNLADELVRLQRQQEGERVEIQQRLSVLDRELSTALRG